MSRSGTAAHDSSDGGAILGASAVMAAGTAVSRLSGFVRGSLLAAALGAYLHADLFTIANTIPNMLYILLAGGVFNAVLVPQLVRAMRNDPDEGEAYTNRIITLAALFLAVVTVSLVFAAPLLTRVFLSDDFFTAELAAQRESVVDFARFCLPQVFFYGMFVLVGQVLNARGRFGPMMWAPIANNLISVAVLAVYLFVFGPARDAEVFGAYTAGQELLLGLGSTLGIVVQLLVLLPFLRAAGVRFRPRFDFRGSGLTHTLRIGVWTVLFVIVNQVAYTVVVRLASEGAAAGATGDPGTGYTIYSQAFLLVMVPHSIATVSLATAVLPQLSGYAAERDLGSVARSVSSTLRTSLALIVPFALLLPLIAHDLANLVYGWLAASEAYVDYVAPLSLFALGLVFFTVHYVVLRGYYALERTRTVFWVQCVVAATNIALALVLTGAVTAEHTASGLVLAYAGAYAVGAVVSYTLLGHLLGGLHTAVLVRFLVRLLIAAGVAAAVAGSAAYAVQLLGPVEDSKVQALVTVAATAAVDVALFLALARAMRLREVADILALVTGRLRRTKT